LEATTVKKKKIPAAAVVKKRAVKAFLTSPPIHSGMPHANQFNGSANDP
jgi:hypothetical protein